MLAQTSRKLDAFWESRSGEFGRLDWDALMQHLTPAELNALAEVPSFQARYTQKCAEGSRTPAQSALSEALAESTAQAV